MTSFERNRGQYTPKNVQERNSPRGLFKEEDFLPRTNEPVAETIGDKMVWCHDCGCRFPWTVEQQAKDAECGYEKPLYCKKCKLNRYFGIENKKKRQSSRNFRR